MCRRAHRTDCRPRRLESEQPHGVGHVPGATSPPQLPGDLARPTAEPLSSHCPRRGRWLRRQDRVVPGILHCPSAVEVDWAAGQVCPDPIRGNAADDPRPRPGPRCRCGLRERWPHECSAPRRHSRPRGLRRSHRAWLSGAHVLDGGRLLQNRQGRYWISYGRHQHHADCGVPRGWSTRGGIHDRTNH